MKPEDTPPRINSTRRALGAIVCLSPVALLAASWLWGGRHPHPDRPWAVGILCLAVALGALNASLAFLRPLVYQWTHGGREPPHHVSPVPLLGTLLVVLGAVLGFGSHLCVLFGLLTLALDVAGLPWFLLATWRDSSLWDS